MRLMALQLHKVGFSLNLLELLDFWGVGRGGGVGGEEGGERRVRQGGGMFRFNLEFFDPPVFFFQE